MEAGEVNDQWEAKQKRHSMQDSAENNRYGVGKKGELALHSHKTDLADAAARATTITRLAWAARQAVKKKKKQNRQRVRVERQGTSQGTSLQPGSPQRKGKLTLQYSKVTTYVPLWDRLGLGSSSGASMPPLQGQKETVKRCSASLGSACAAEMARGQRQDPGFMVPMGGIG